MHLSDVTYRPLLRSSLPPAAARPLSVHLARECDICEGWLLARPAADGLDGMVDASLASLAPAGEAAGTGHDIEFARIMARVRAPAARGSPGPQARPAPPAPRRRAGPAVALAASVLLAGLAGLLWTKAGPRPQPWDGLKGAAAEAVPLRLRFLVLTPVAGGAPGIEKGVPGQEVPADASLQFQVELGRPAEVVLIRTGAGGTYDVFFRARLPAGRSAVSVGGQPAAYPLSTLAGPQRFLALASERPIEPADVGRAAALGAAARLGEGQVISLDQVEVQVRPSMGR